MTREQFIAMAERAGIKATPEHLDTLHAEVEALLRRMAPLHDIDLSETAPEDAGMTRDGGAA